jgi:hypothetical protein
MSELLKKGIGKERTISRIVSGIPEWKDVHRDPGTAAPTASTGICSQTTQLKARTRIRGR